ncbi:LysR family transcriptional regulator [Azospirillum sp. RWY-5-1]|uniref:LysR family transcriptional regulator n=1 Tax=Azospirillum oleiclasticum TaxID=2735135 RepID=A0ABX2TFZ9_9PROT|nr:LysR substrate-binding domain-containing protein [Azospirillum oleiclasticum]NYZ14384.1 LysR family transcriptional regulator [Azospirillum oleiclasticum]NYZ23264.1 LysR family transcriptional regulator [Azospirillum oleiclasticum]
MKTPSQNLTALRSFHAMVSAGGIAAAAKALNVTPGAIRHQLRQLEQEVGQSLFVRSKRDLTLTAAGTKLFESVGRAFADIASVCRDLSATDVKGELRVSCAPAFAALRLMRVIDAFAQSFPFMSVRLYQMDQADGTMDVVIAYGECSAPGTRIAILRDEVYFPVCSPALAYQCEVTKPESLSGLVGLHARDRTDWSRLLGASSKRPIHFRQEVILPDAHLSIQAAREGLGIAVGTSILCAEDLRRGTLVRPIGIEVPAPNPYFIIQPDVGRSHAVEAFVAMLLDQVEAVPAER